MADYLKDLALSQGPAIILEAHRYRSIQGISSLLDEPGRDTLPEILEGFISLPLQKVFEERKLKPDIPCWESILGNIHGANDMCTCFMTKLLYCYLSSNQYVGHRCAARGFDLWNETSKLILCETYFFSEFLALRLGISARLTFDEQGVPSIFDEGKPSSQLGRRTFI